MVVVFLDVRGFTSFARIAESTDTAEFLKTVYIKILDEYFEDAVFFKPTGDGLLILLDYDRGTLTKVVRAAVTRSIALVEAFPSICDGDEMINFEVPAQVGIGLTRGSATALTAKGKVLDYSGRPLNLASRLMDLARPSGVVFDRSFGFQLLDQDTRSRFNEDSAYVKGVAESVPMPVYCLNGYTRIPEHNKKPLDGYTRFTEPVETVTLKNLEARGIFRHNLSRAPARTDNIELHLSYPDVRRDGSKHPSLIRFVAIPAEFGAAAGKTYAAVDYRQQVASMKERGVKSGWNITLTLEYSIMPDDQA